MLCAKLATRKDGFQFPCGQCLNCKINKRRDWQSRLLLEAASHAYGAFVTLTFADAGVPPILRKSDVISFIRSIRAVHPNVRYFAVGEYGSNTGRAHYHVHLFTDRPVLSAHVREAWPFGRIHLGDTEPASLDYCLGYLLKDRKAVAWPVESRFPEFRLYSQGLGKFALPHLLVDGTELPREFTVFGRRWPIGRYLRDRAKKMGFTVSDREITKAEFIEAQAMRSLLKNPQLSKAEIEKLYQEFADMKNQRSQELQKRAIRAAYLQQHGHLKKVNHETF